jgi:hypothetical protein
LYVKVYKNCTTNKSSHSVVVVVVVVVSRSIVCWLEQQPSATATLYGQSLLTVHLLQHMQMVVVPMIYQQQHAAATTYGQSQLTDHSLLQHKQSDGGEWQCGTTSTAAATELAIAVSPQCIYYTAQMAEWYHNVML